jgi:ABC-2 type transport system permease protein
MFLRIIKTEWRNLFSERSFLIAALSFGGLLGYGIWSGAAWIDQRYTQSLDLIETQEKELADRKAKIAQGFTGSTDSVNFQPDPRDPYTTGASLQYASLPFSSTAVFSVGQADVLTLDAPVTTSAIQRTKADKAGFENPLSFLAGRFDLSFVVVYLLPLFVLALSFNILSGERERGTLQLLLSQPLKLKSLLTAKAFAQFILILGLVLLVSLAGVFLTRPEFTVDFAARTILWMLLVVSYVAFWFGTAVLINSFGFSSAANAVVCAASWLILVLILPSLLNVAISSAYPVPSRTELVSAVRGVNLDVRRDVGNILSEHYQDHPELIPKDGKADLNNFTLAAVAVNREQRRRFDAVEDRFAEQLAHQQSMIRNFRFLSPSIIAQEASNDVAGTGLTRYQHFRSQVKQLDAAWADYFVPRIFRQEKLSAADFDTIPRFHFNEESLDGVTGRVSTGIAFLFLLTAGLLLLAFGKLAKFELAK